MAIDRDDVRWAYKILLEREPESIENVDRIIAGFPDMKSLKAMIFSSDEFFAVNRAFIKTLPAPVAPSSEPHVVNGRAYKDLSSLDDIAGTQSAHEKAEVAFVAKHLRDGHTFVDLGGGRGIFSIIAATCVGAGGHVYTIESDPEWVSLIRRNSQENKVEQQIKIIRATLTSQPSTSGGRLPDATGADAAVSHSPDDGVTEGTLDSLFGATRRINFIRTDLRGAEIPAFEGARHILSRDRPLILSKIDPVQLLRVSGNSWQYLFGLLTGHGYKPHILDKAGLGKSHPHLEAGHEYTIVFSTTGHYLG